MQQAARAAYDQTKLGPQLILLILPVRLDFVACQSTRLTSQRKEQQMYGIIKQVAGERIAAELGRC